MITPQDEQRLRDAFAEVGRNAPFTDECPPADRLWAASRGEVPPAEMLTLTDHLIECGACAAAWRSALDFGPGAHAGRSPSPITFTRMLLPLAAAIVLIVGGVIGYRLLQERDPGALHRADAGGRQSDVALPAQPVLELQVAAIRVPAEYGLVWRGATDGQAFLEALAAALAPYRTGDYATAATLLAALAREHPDLPEPSFYLGVAQLMAGRPVEAQAALARARARARGEIADGIEWYRAIADERAGQPAAALEKLQTLCAAAGSGASRACAGARALGAP